MYDIYNEVQEELNNYREDLLNAETNWPTDVIKVYNNLNKHLFEQGITIDQLKKECFVNGKNFSGKFRFYVGKSPKKYLSHHRISMAEKLLLDKRFEEIKIIDISLLLGFDTHAAFSISFKKEKNNSPSTWRVLHKKRKKV